VNKTKEKQSQQSIISKKQKVKAWRWTRCKQFRVVIINPTDLQHRTFREAVSLLKTWSKTMGGRRKSVMPDFPAGPRLCCSYCSVQRKLIFYAMPVPVR